MMLNELIAGTAERSHVEAYLKEFFVWLQGQREKA
jgi:hypothetical protein